MSERGRDYDDHPKAKQGNKAITIFLLTLVVLLGGALAVVTLAFFKQQEQLATKSTLTPVTPAPAPLSPPLPTPEATATPTPSPVALAPSPTPTASPSVSPSVSPPVSNSLSGDNKPTEYKNTDLPGYFPSEGFKAPPSDLSRFKKGNPLLREMVISGQNYITSLKDKMLVRGQLYYPVFSLSGSQNEQRVGFELDGVQKAVLLQFGLQDLTAGDTNLTYLIRLSADGKLLWAGECRYGKNQQLISVPLDVPGAKSLVIEYAVTERGDFSPYNLPRLYMTKAELLYE